MRSLFGSHDSVLPILLLLSVPVLTIAISTPARKNFYHPGDLIDLTCLNRTIDTGEHVQDTHGHLQYIPFPPPPLTCSETQTTLRLPFLSESPFNCTIATLTDELYHLLEFYVHADSPLSCRIPRRPPGGERDLSTSGTSGAEAGEAGEEWIPLVISLAGKIELSHLHISNRLNLVVHISPDEIEYSTSGSSSPGMIIDSASGYSTSPLSPGSQTKIIPGDPLPLFITPRWYPTPTLPRGTIGSLTTAKEKKPQPPTWAPGTGAYQGGHVTVHTLIYCALSCLATAVLCTGYFRGWEFPRRLRNHGYDRRGGGAGGMFDRNGNGANGNGGRPVYGYGVGVGGFGGYGGGSGTEGGFGKKD